eukprot:COSAG06_NODE_5253_length_3605_cov_72.692812_2_plen_55_part_00
MAQKCRFSQGGLTKEVLEHWDSYRYEAAQHNTIAQHSTATAGCSNCVLHESVYL